MEPVRSKECSPKVSEGLETQEIMVCKLKWKYLKYVNTDSTLIYLNNLLMSTSCCISFILHVIPYVPKSSNVLIISILIFNIVSDVSPQMFRHLEQNWLNWENLCDKNYIEGYIEVIKKK